MVVICYLHVSVCGLYGTEKKEKPTLTPLSDVECTEQEEVRFETTVTGKPEPTVEWYDFTAIL